LREPVIGLFGGKPRRIRHCCAPGLRCRALARRAMAAYGRGTSRRLTWIKARFGAISNPKFRYPRTGVGGVRRRHSGSQAAGALRRRMEFEERPGEPRLPNMTAS